MGRIVVRSHPNVTESVLSSKWADVFRGVFPPGRGVNWDAAIGIRILDRRPAAVAGTVWSAEHVHKGVPAW